MAVTLDRTVVSVDGWCREFVLISSLSGHQAPESLQLS